jgi:hypothetical protein
LEEIDTDGEDNIKMNLNGIDYEIVGSIRVAYDSSDGRINKQNDEFLSVINGEA